MLPKFVRQLPEYRKQWIALRNANSKSTGSLALDQKLFKLYGSWGTNCQLNSVTTTK